MKKLLVGFLVLSLAISISLFYASAETTSLLPENVSDWKSVSEQTKTATAEIKDGTTVISGSTQFWPSVAYSMPEEKQVTVPIEGMSVEYEFMVDKGASNIFIYFKGATPENPDDNFFKLMDCIDTPNKDAGSSDVTAGTYKGAVRLDEMTANFNFPGTAVNDDNTITFSGLSIYSVAGATVTVNKLQIVPTNTVTESNVTQNISEQSTILSDNNTSGEASAAETTITSDESDNQEKTDDSEEDIDPIWYAVLGGAALIAFIIVIIVAAKKKN